MNHCRFNKVSNLNLKHPQGGQPKTTEKITHYSQFWKISGRIRLLFCEQMLDSWKFLFVKITLWVLKMCLI